MMYDVGDTATVTTELRDADGELIAATVVITVTKPDGTTLTPVPDVVSNGGTGLYKALVPVSVAGTWRYKWTASGAVTAVDGGQVEVVDVGRVLVAGLDEFRAQLDRSDTSDDTELRIYLESATNQVEWLVGPLSPTTITERHRAVDLIPLRRFPVMSVESLTVVLAGVAGSALSTSDYYVDVDNGEISVYSYRSMYGRCEYEVAYTIGRTSISVDIKLAGLIIAQHLWAVENGRFTINAPGEDTLALVPGSGWLIPHRALELLRPHPSVMNIGGIA